MIRKGTEKVQKSIRKGHDDGKIKGIFYKFQNTGIWRRTSDKVKVDDQKSRYR